MTDQKSNLSQRVTTHSYDLTGLGVLRAVKHYIISKMAPEEENFAGGPGWKCLLLLGVLHGLGRIAGWGIFLFGPRAKLLISTLRSKPKN